jgi:diguanylate cyclase (GGDEF)-like protein
MSAAPEDFDAAIDRLAQQAMARPAGTLVELDALARSLGPQTPPLASVHLARVRGLALVYSGNASAGLPLLLQAHEAVCGPSTTQEPALRFAVQRNLSMAYAQLGLPDAALEWANRALELAREAGDEALLAEALLSCGVALSRAGQAERGLQLYEQALPLLLAQQNGRSAVSVLNNLGINLKNLGRAADALERFEQALALCAEQGLHDQAAVLRTNLPEPLAQLGRLAEARAVGLRAAAEMQAAGHRPAELSARRGLGLVLLECGEPEAARAELERALELAQQLGDRIDQARCSQQLAQLHKSAGRFEQALLLQEKVQELERAQFSHDFERRLRAQQTQTDLAAARHDVLQERSRRAELEQAQIELMRLNEKLQAADREKSRLLARLAEESRTDALTGLANRRRLDERLADEWHRLRRYAGTRLSLAIVDVDHFKQVNDRFGHPLGDAVLQRLARLLAQRSRAGDLAARLGGEEFCLLLPDTEGADALQACEHLREAVAAEPWAQLHPELRLSVSIGLADAREVDDAAALLQRADERLYAAKQAGRNRVQG